MFPRWEQEIRGAHGMRPSGSRATSASSCTSNITFTCGATTLEPPQPLESAGAAGIDLSVEVTTAAPPGLRLKAKSVEAQIETRSTAEGRLICNCATLGRRTPIAVRCYVCWVAEHDIVASTMLSKAL